MTKPVTLNVRISGVLRHFIAAHVGDDGAYENVGEYVRDLIRRDKELNERDMFARLKAELTHAFGERESSYAALDADSVIARNRRG